jgi:hypothetical protein
MKNTRKGIEKDDFVSVFSNILPTLSDLDVIPLKRLISLGHIKKRSSSSVLWSKKYGYSTGFKNG